MRRIVISVVAVLVLTHLASAQKGPFDDDLKNLTASGSVAGNVYSNQYAGLRLKLPQPPCEPKLNTQVDLGRGTAILLDCVHAVQGLGGMYTLKLAVDYRVNHPSIKNLTDYARQLRRSAEGSGTTSVETETTRTIDGHEFVQAMLVTKLPNVTYYQGFVCTQVRGWILVYEVEAPTIQMARSLMDLTQRLDVAPKPARQ